MANQKEIDIGSVPGKTVVVLGMGRGGTSMTCGVLNILGVDFGENLKPADSGNVKGYFEDMEIQDLYRKIYETTGVDIFRWEIPSFEQIQKVENQFREEIKNLIQKKQQDKKIWGIKGIPSFDLFLPYVHNPYFVFVFRNILDTARSINKGNKQVSVLAGMRRSIFCYSEISRFIERHPYLPKIFISFEETTNQPLKTARELANFLGLELTEQKVNQIKKFVILRNKIEKEKMKKKLEMYLKNPMRVIRYLYRRLKRLNNNSK